MDSVRENLHSETRVEHYVVPILFRLVGVQDSHTTHSSTQRQKVRQRCESAREMDPWANQIVEHMRNIRLDQPAAHEVVNANPGTDSPQVGSPH